MKKNIFLALMILMILFSCNNINEKTEYYPSGNIESIKNDSLTTYYYDVKDLPFKKIYHLKDYDSIVLYYKNGKNFKNGKRNKDGKKFGNWNKYTNEGLLSEKIEYFIVNDKVVPNRFWFFNREGDTLWYSSKFNRYDQKEFVNDTLGAKNSTMIEFNIYTKDTIDIEEPFLASVICNTPLGREYNSEIMMLLAKEDFNFNSDFSNEKKVKLDTFYNVRIDKINRANFTYTNNPSEKYNYIAAFGKWFKTPGEKILRGYMLETFLIEKVGKKVAKGERRVYFEKRIYVRDKKQK